MSGHCDWCDIWHSGSCCHPGRALYADLEVKIAALREQLREAIKWRDEACQQNDIWEGVVDERIADIRSLREQLREADERISMFKKANEQIGDLCDEVGIDRDRLRDAIGALTPHEYRLLSDDVDLICGEEVEQRVVVALRALAEIAKEGKTPDARRRGPPGGTMTRSDDHITIRG